MTEKILILDRTKNLLEIRDDDDAYSYSYLQNITHIKKDKTEYGTENRIFGIFSKHIQMGFVTNVKEIREVW